MIASYHNHTFRCHHANGSEREYIENAIKEGLRVIGFSDHTPMPFEGDYYSHFRMRFDGFDDYCRTLTALREEYKNRIKILIGLEVEYYPKLFPVLLERIQGTPVEYLLLGQHFTNNETDGVYSGTVTEDEQTLVTYVDQVIEGMKTGYFTYVAHPDLLHYIADDDVFYREMLRLCNAGRELGVPMEVNFLGIRDHRHYPSLIYFDALRDSGCDVVLGCDAHEAKDVYDRESERVALRLLSERGMTPLSTVRIRPVQIGGKQ